jgi:hypothetical protein
MRMIATTIIAAILTLPAVVLAQTGTGTIVCHVIHGAETANASLNGTQLRCRAVNIDKIRELEQAVMKLMNEGQLTPSQLEEMKSMVNQMNGELELPVIPGTNGNPNN